MHWDWRKLNPLTFPATHVVDQDLFPGGCTLPGGRLDNRGSSMLVRGKLGGFLHESLHAWHGKSWGQRSSFVQRPQQFLRDPFVPCPVPRWTTAITHVVPCPRPARLLLHSMPRLLGCTLGLVAPFMIARRPHESTQLVLNPQLWLH